MIQPFLSYLSSEKRYSVHTLNSYGEDLKQLEAFLSVEYEIADLKHASTPHLRAMVAALSEKGLAPATINRKIATYKSFYKFLVARQYVEQNPANSVKALKKDKKLPSFLKEAEVETLLDRVEYSHDFTGQRDKLIIELFYGTGMRLAELCGLKLSDVNFYEKSLKVLGKRNKERIIPVGAALLKQVEVYHKLKEAEGFDDQMLLVTDTGKQAYPMFIYRKVKQHLSLVTTLSKRSPHVLRHTFATHLLNKGADLNAVKDLLGHTSLAATQVYTHNSIEKLKVAFDQAHPKA